jgi:hypothetical protein
MGQVELDRGSRATLASDAPRLRTTHESLIFVRNKVYAHTDEEINARWIVDISADLGVEGPVFVPA